MFMDDKISFVKMSRAVAETYFKDFAFDPAVFLDGQAVKIFEYSDAWLDSYLVRHKDNVHLAIIHCGKPIGEILFKHMDYSKHTAVLSIHLQNDSVKEKGYGTEAVGLAVEYAFNVLHLQVLHADVNKNNSRSIHVLEKAGFQYIKEDEYFCYYDIRNATPDP